MINNILTKTSPSFLIIGYGNDLRSDDAIGQKVIDAIATWDLPNIQTLSVRQLTPELAQTLATVDFAIFVDAYPTVEETEQEQEKGRGGEIFPCLLVPLSPSPEPIIGHTSNPGYLLALTQAVYGRAPQAWWLMVPGENFELGDSLSPVGEEGIQAALVEIDSLIQTART